MRQETLRLQTISEEATLELGRLIGTALLENIPSKIKTGVMVLLIGELGAGKTTLVRGIGGPLGLTRVKSPSFTLINEYHTPNLSIIHADLYRLESGKADELGLGEYLENQNVLLIEWPERLAELDRHGALKIFIESGNDKSERAFEISSKGEAAGLLLEYLREAVKNGEFNTCAGLQLTLD